MKRLALVCFATVAAGAAAVAGLSYWRGTNVLADAMQSAGLYSPVFATEAKSNKLASVRVVRPEKTPGGSTLTLSGRTAPAEQALISSRATGVVAERRADIGDRVKAGDVLLTIDAPVVEQELQRAKAAVDQNKARLELARVNLGRAENLVGNGHIAVQTVDERRANKMIAEADLQAAMAEVKRLEDVRGFQTVRAPFDGTIVARQVERGDKVSAEGGQQGTYLLRLASLTTLKIEIDVQHFLFNPVQKPRSHSRNCQVKSASRASFGRPV